MERKETLNSFQIIIGLLLCAGFIVVAFAIPRIGVDSSKLSDMMMDKVLEAFENAGGGNGLSKLQLDEFQDAIQDEEKIAQAKEQMQISLDEAMNGWREKEIPLRMTNWGIISYSFQNLSVSQSVARNYNLYRALVGVMTILPFLILLFLLLHLFCHISRMPVLILSWLSVMANAVYLIVWYLILPQLFGDSIRELGNQVFGFGTVFDVDSNAFASAVLNTMNMNGFLFWNILVVLLAVWSIFGIIVQDNMPIKG